MCERATYIGQALDVITDIYRQFLSQFSALSDTRMRLMQSPSQYMVTPMYYCDRALSSLVHAIAEVRAGINTLYEQLRDVYDVVVQKCDSAEKMYREVEIAAKSDMAHFVEERKAKCVVSDIQWAVLLDMNRSLTATFNPTSIFLFFTRATVFRELSDRICSVRDGGSTIFLFLDKQWCTSSSLCTKILGIQQPSLHHGGEQALRAEQVAVDDKSADLVPHTPDEQPHNSAPLTQTIQLGKMLGGIPETPEVKRVPNNEAPITQVSSPRQRNSSARKGSHAVRIASENRIEGHGPPVERNLILDSSQAGGELNVRQQRQTNVTKTHLNAKEPTVSEHKLASPPAEEKRHSNPDDDIQNPSLSMLHSREK